MKYSEKYLYDLYGAFLKRHSRFYSSFFLTHLFDVMSNHDMLDANQIREKWVKKIESGERKNDETAKCLNFYIHVPFCRSKCRYCMYFSVIRYPQNKDVEGYIRRLIQQMNFFKKTFQKKKFNSLYIGGGTPSILTEDQLQKFLDALFTTFHFRKFNNDITFECNPQSTNLKKLKIIKSYGFNRVSFGVESINQKVLFGENRGYQSFGSIEKVVKEAQSCGLEVNTDIMAGLDGESINSIIESFMTLAKLKVYSISIYPHKPSLEYLHGRDYYKYNINLNCKMKKIISYLKKFGPKINFFIDKEINQGNEILSVMEPTFYLGKDGPGSAFRYDYNRLEPTSLFSLGPCSCSTIFGYSRYKDITTKSFEKDFDPTEKAYSTVNFNLRNEMQYFILHKLSIRYDFSLNEFHNFFKKYSGNNRFEEIFKDEIRSLRRLKKIKIENDTVIMPNQPFERYRTALFILNEKNNIRKIRYFFSKNYLKIQINKRPFLIQIEKIKKKKQYFYQSGEYGYYFIRPPKKIKLLESEGCFFHSFNFLFRSCVSKKYNKNAEMVRDSLVILLNEIIEFKKINLINPSAQIKVSKEKPLSKNEKYIF